jgi:transcriptional regulator with XRE-family HTH domain
MIGDALQMSTRRNRSDAESAEGFPELTPLGKHIEVLRIGRGYSKQRLARFAGTSRQQLWRVMTGKSQLTDALRQRLAHALEVETASLTPDATGTSVSPATSRAASRAAPPAIGISLETYLSAPALAERTLRTLPNGDAGRELKRAILTVLEDLAIQHHIPLPGEFFDLRRRVLADEL